MAMSDAELTRPAGIQVHPRADGDTLDLRQYAPPEPPENGQQLPAINEHGAVFWRGDDTEIAEALIAHWLGPHSVATAGEVWQWQPAKRGWARIPTEALVCWLSTIAGAPVWGGLNRNQEPVLKPLVLSNARIRGAVAIAYARLHHDEDEGDFDEFKECAGCLRIGSSPEPLPCGQNRFFYDHSFETIISGPLEPLLSVLSWTNLW